ncbi:MAG: FHA domain-containing protein [Candidatus Brocadiia bacterium]
MPGLIIETADRQVKSFNLTEEAIIGREKTNNVYIDDPRASRQHSRIVKQPDGYYISDINSRNGTLVNGEKITMRKLKDNDRIVIGRTTITYKETLDATDQTKTNEITQKQTSGSADMPPSAKSDAATADLSSGIKGTNGPDISKSKEAVSEMAKIAGKAYGNGSKPTPAPRPVKISAVQEPVQSGSFFTKLLLFIALLIFFLALLFVSKWAGEKLISAIAKRHTNKNITQPTAPPIGGADEPKDNK